MLSHDKATCTGGEGVGIRVDFNAEPSARLRVVCVCVNIRMCECMCVVCTCVVRLYVYNATLLSNHSGMHVLTNDISCSNTVVIIDLVQYGCPEDLKAYKWTPHETIIYQYMYIPLLQPTKVSPNSLLLQSREQRTVPATPVSPTLTFLS